MNNLRYAALMIGVMVLLAACGPAAIPEMEPGDGGISEPAGTAVAITTPESGATAEVPEAMQSAGQRVGAPAPETTVPPPTGGEEERSGDEAQAAAPADVRSLFVTARDPLCTEQDDGLPGTSQSVACVFPDVTVWYLRFDDASAPTTYLDALNQTPMAIPIERAGWTDEASGYTGEYMLYSPATATLVWRVEGTPFVGYAFRQDRDETALKTWWQTMGNQVAPPAPAQPTNSVPTPRSELAGYFTTIHDQCTEVDDGNPDSLVTVRCLVSNSAGQTVTVDYARWVGWVPASFVDDAISPDDSCNQSNWWHVGDPRKTVQGHVKWCITEDNQSSYVVWTVYDKSLSGFAIVQNNDVSSLLDLWSTQLSRHR